MIIVLATTIPPTNIANTRIAATMAYMLCISSVFWANSLLNEAGFREAAINRVDKGLRLGRIFHINKDKADRAPAVEQPLGSAQRNHAPAILVGYAGFKDPDHFIAVVIERQRVV